MNKIKGGALQLTLFIVVVIALLLASFILLVHTNKRFDIQTDFVIETVNNSTKGIHYALTNNVSLNDTNTINLNDEDYKSLKVNRSFWGVFEKVTTTSKIKTHSFQKVALIGAKQPNNNRTALYVQDNNKPLVLVGNTKIEGSVYLPQKGVKVGTISGESYYGTSLIYGLTKQAASLPKLFKETTHNLENIKKEIENINQNQCLNSLETKQYSNSFLKPLKVVYNTTDINLNGVSLTGHIVVFSRTKITVDASSKLKDVILIAPEIEIRANVKGSFQAIASKNVVVGSNCILEYPSALVLVEDSNISAEIENQNSLASQIKIGDNAKIKGTVVFIGNETQNKYKANIDIEKNANIYGEVYCTENVELKGSVFGTVFTNNFIVHKSGSIYQNHIYNGKIIVNDLPEQYVGLPFNDSKKGVVKWLY